MHVDSQFTVGIHTLMVVGFFEDDKITSEKIARSIGCNPVIVRKVSAKLAKAGLLVPGKGRAKTVLGKSPGKITLYDIFKATQEQEADDIFNMYPANLNCPVGKEIHDILSSRFESAVKAMGRDLSETTLSDLISELPADKKRLPENMRRSNPQSFLAIGLTNFASPSTCSMNSKSSKVKCPRYVLMSERERIAQTYPFLVREKNLIFLPVSTVLILRSPSSVN